MNLMIATLPDEESLRPQWLDAHLVGDAWGVVVNEFAALQATEERPLDSILGAERAAVLERGLSALPAERRRMLLGAPQAMLDLQERVLLEGGPYWQSLPRPDGLHQAAERGRAALRPSERKTSPVWQRLMPMALAASVLLALYLGGAFAPAPQPWRGGGPLVTAKAYLLDLAEQAAPWSNTSADPVVLKGQLAEFQTWCQFQMESEHPPLKPEQQAWLKEKCRKWSADLETQSAALARGEPAANVKANVDALVQRLTTTLRQEAGQLG